MTVVVAAQRTRVVEAVAEANNSPSLETVEEQRNFLRKGGRGGTGDQLRPRQKQRHGAAWMHTSMIARFDPTSPNGPMTLGPRRLER